MKSNDPLRYLLIKSSTFFRIAAACSCLGALTTAYLMLVPSPSATSELEQAMLSSNSTYLSKLWVLFLHPQFNFIAVLGCGLLLMRNALWQVILAILFLAIWAYTELSQQALLIDALNQLWRPGFLNASPTEAQFDYTTIFQVASGISDSQYFVVIYGFGMGSIFLGWAFLKSNQLARILGMVSILIGVFSLISFGSYYLQLNFFSPITEMWYRYLYPYLQPLLRLAISWWILVTHRSDFVSREACSQ